jgi:hypothetical protein
MINGAFERMMAEVSNLRLVRKAINTPEKLPNRNEGK